MNKKAKIISMTAAALLAVAPVIATTVSTVHADESGYITYKDYKSYFTYQGVKLSASGSNPFANGSGIEIPVGEKMTLQELLDKMKGMVEFHGAEKDNEIITTTSNIYSDLTAQGISVSENSPSGTFTVSDKDFSTTLSGSNPTPQVTNWPSGNPAPKVTSWVGFDFHPVKVTTSPVIRVTYTQNGFKIDNILQDQIFQVSEGAKFNPTDFVGSNGTRYTFSATSSSDSKTFVKVTGDGSKVDTSKPGSHYKVTLTATNSEGKETKSSYTVFVKPNMTLTHDNGYSFWYNFFKDNSNMSEGGSTISNGTKVYVGNDTIIYKGVSYTKFSEISEADANSTDSNRWIDTKVLMSESQAPETTTKTVMHKATIYDADGKSRSKTVAAYANVKVDSLPVEIDGREYYKLSDGSGYIKATNIDGTVRTLKHNAYIYATSTRRANSQVMKKGTRIRTYGGSYKFKNGKRYYRIEGATKSKKMYIKVANFK